MNTVRKDMKLSTPLETNGLVDEFMDAVECRVWVRFDILKRTGKLKVWGFIDASSIVAMALVFIFGDRPEGCPE